jgi:hypothetical protein
MHMQASTDTATPVRPRRRHGGGDPAIDLVISILKCGCVMIVALPDAKIGPMRNLLVDPDGDGQFVWGIFCAGCARKHLARIKRPFGWHVEPDDEAMVVLKTAAERRGVIERIGMVRVH